MSELTPDVAALHPSQLEPEQGCDPGALPTWLASCEMSPAIPMVWMSCFKGKYRKTSLSCKLSCSLSPSLNILHCIFLCMLQLLCSPQMLSCISKSCNLSELGSFLHGTPCNDLEKQQGSHAAVKCSVPTHLESKRVQLPHEGSLDADAAGRDALTFQIFPVSGYQLTINQEWE